MATGAEVSEFKTGCAQDISKARCAHPSGNRYPTLFRYREGEGREEEEWHLTSFTPFSVQIDSLTGHFLTLPLTKQQHLLAYLLNMAQYPLRLLGQPCSAMIRTKLVGSLVELPFPIA